MKNFKNPFAVLLLALICSSSIKAQPLIVVTNNPSAAGSPSFNFGPATFSAFRGEDVTAPNTVLSSNDLAYLGIAGGSNPNSIDNADGIAGGTNQERMRIGIHFGYSLDRLTWSWSRADGPLATDGVRIAGFLSDPGAVFSGGLNGVTPVYNSGTLTFQVSDLNASVQSISFTNPAATTGATLEVSVADSTQSNPQFSITSANFTAPAATIFSSGFDGNTAPVSTADGVSGALLLSVPWTKAATVTGITALTAVCTGDSGTSGGFIRLPGSSYLASSNNIFINRNLNADTDPATSRRGFSLTFSVNSPIDLGSLVVLAGHATSSGLDQVFQSTLVYQLSGGSLQLPVTGNSVEDYSLNPPFHTVSFDLTGTTILPGAYTLEIYETSLVGGGAFAIYDGIALYAAATNPIPGSLTLATLQNQPTNLPVATLIRHGNDPAGNPMEVTGVSAASSNGGTVSLNSGIITYTPAPDYKGLDEFSYTLSNDHGGNASGTVQVAVLKQTQNYNRLMPPVFTGTNSVVLNYFGVPYCMYALDWATNLSPSIHWMPLGTNMAPTSGITTFACELRGPENYFRTRYVSLPHHAVETQINGDFWFDVNGNKVDATDMSIVKVGPYYYAFGSKRLLSSSYYDETFKEFRCYRSTNLRDWEFRATALTAADLGLGTTYSARCKVIYNASTDKYVMWFKLKNNDIGRVMGVAVSSSVEGPYSFVGIRHATSGDTGDMSLFQEGTNAYVIASDVATRDLVIDELTSDYLDIASHVYTIPAYLEAPQLFKVGDRYFCIGSGVTGWTPNQSKYCSSTSLTGGWTAWANFGDDTTYDSQGSDVFVIHGTEATTAIFCADRWETPYLGNITGVWLPISINGSTASINYMDSFVVDATTGIWSSGPAHYYKIINKYSGKALSVIAADAGGNPLPRTSNAADIVQWTYDDNQDWCKWQVEGTTDGYKKIINKYSGLAMEVMAVNLDGSSPYAATNNAADICQANYNSNDDTFKWKCQELGNGNGYRSVINKYSGKAATVFAQDAAGNPWPRTADGADVAQYDFTSTQDWYQWQFVLLP